VVFAGTLRGDELDHFLDLDLLGSVDLGVVLLGGQGRGQEKGEKKGK
jgi:hypothetical protein